MLRKTKIDPFSCCYASAVSYDRSSRLHWICIWMLHFLCLWQLGHLSSGSFVPLVTFPQPLPWWADCKSKHCICQYCFSSSVLGVLFVKIQNWSRFPRSYLSWFFSFIDLFSHALSSVRLSKGNSPLPPPQYIYSLQVSHSFSQLKPGVWLWILKAPKLHHQKSRRIWGVHDRERCANLTRLLTEKGGGVSLGQGVKIS